MQETKQVTKVIPSTNGCSGMDPTAVLVRIVFLYPGPLKANSSGWLCVLRFFASSRLYMI